MIDAYGDGNDPYYDYYNAPTPGQPTATSYPWWSDPDTAPPDWMLNPQTPPIQATPGKYWNWSGDHWEMLDAPTAQPRPQRDPSSDAPPTGHPSPPDRNPGPGPSGGLNTAGGFGGWPSYQAPNFVDPGSFNPGSPFSYKDFSAPQGQDVLKDPGFQFRMDQGRKALEASAAGKGVLRSGGTLKDLLSYGQNFGAQEYGNVFNRAVTEYDLNRRNRFDEWQSGYQGRKDQYGFGADRANSLNSFNVGNAQFDFSGRQRQAEQDMNDALQRWMASGNWTKDLALGGLN